MQVAGGDRRMLVFALARQAEARRYVPLATTATRELRSGHLQMGAPWLRQGRGHVSCGGAERGWRPEGDAATGGEKQIPHTARKGRDRVRDDNAGVRRAGRRLKPCPDADGALKGRQYGDEEAGEARRRHGSAVPLRCSLRSLGRPKPAATGARCRLIGVGLEEDEDYYAGD